MKYFNLGQINGALLLTYLNALLGVAGIIAVFYGYIELAFILLIVAAVCDAFDGLVARLKKQTSEQKALGVIADSMADMVSFGVLPVVIFLSVVELDWLNCVVAMVFVFAAIHRLVVFTETTLKSNTPTRHFTGLPVIMGVIALPVTYILFGSFGWFESLMTALVLVLALLFVSKVRIPKPHGVGAYVSYLVIATLVISGLVLW